MARRKATLEEWVAPQPISDVCAKETRDKGGERLCVPWFRHKSEDIGGPAEGNSGNNFGIVKGMAATVIRQA